MDWIAVDWGTSALRAWAIGADGAVLDEARSGDGMGSLDREGYEPALLRLIGAWLPAKPARPIQVIVCGMAGARQGWREAPYRSVPCAPVGGDQLEPVATTETRISVSIVPGLSQAGPPDVMRGEETQLAGLAAKLGPATATVCMPGTHSKWVSLDRGKVTGFTTFMTGEAFALFAERSVLRHSVDAADTDGDAFGSAVAETVDRPERLTSALFGIRAGSLLEGASAATARSRLSGLLIGAELAAVRPQWDGRNVHIVGASALAASYAAALEQLGGKPVIEDAEELTLAGLAAARSSIA
ncbi:MAG: 2-dehydro-3-deoxygalactonokinase [Rhizobiaceae bacterium]|nr:2-dehydro-3-deoxygalactonokinase [Rhizobiaceae bacterium]